MKESLQNIGWVILGFAFLAGFILLSALFLYGALWVSSKLYPWLVAVSGITMAITFFVLLPNAIFSAIPRFAGTGMVIASYVFGANLWVWSLLLTYVLWGGWALFIGLFMFGVGIVPIAMLATLFKGMWSTLGELVLLTALTFGIRLWGVYLLAKVEERTLQNPSLE